MEEKKAAKMSIGWKIGGVLAILTLLEYWVAVSFTGNLPYLAIAGFAKAFLIVKYFMHISQLWNEGEDH